MRIWLCYVISTERQAELHKLTAEELKVRPTFEILSLKMYANSPRDWGNNHPLFPKDHSVVTVVRNYWMKINCCDWNTSECKEFSDSSEGGYLRILFMITGCSSVFVWLVGFKGIFQEIVSGQKLIEQVTDLQRKANSVKTLSVYSVL